MKKGAKKNVENLEESERIAADENEPERLEDSGAQQPDSPAPAAAKSESLNRVFVNLLNKFRRNNEAKLDETSASDFEKVELTDDKHQEKKDAEKSTETATENNGEETEEEAAEAKVEKVKITTKFRAFFGKYTKKTKKDDGDCDETAAAEEAEKDDKTAPAEEKTDKTEEKMEELEPEDKETKDDIKEDKRIGSETPV